MRQLLAQLHRVPFPPGCARLEDAVSTALPPWCGGRWPPGPVPPLARVTQRNEWMAPDDEYDT